MKKIIGAVLFILLVFQLLAFAFDPGAYDIIMQAGEDFRLTMALKDSNGTAINLTGNTYSAQFRSAPAPAGVVFATYSASASAPASGQVTIKLSKAQTTNTSGKTGLWDLKQTDAAGSVSYLLAGKVIVKPTVTR